MRYRRNPPQPTLSVAQEFALERMLSEGGKSLLRTRTANALERFGYVKLGKAVKGVLAPARFTPRGLRRAKALR